MTLTASSRKRAESYRPRMNSLQMNIKWEKQISSGASKEQRQDVPVLRSEKNCSASIPGEYCWPRGCYVRASLDRVRQKTNRHALGHLLMQLEMVGTCNWRLHNKSPVYYWNCQKHCGDIRQTTLIFKDRAAASDSYLRRKERQAKWAAPRAAIKPEQVSDECHFTRAGQNIRNTRWC